jgi:hypothetical protein
MFQKDAIVRLLRDNDPATVTLLKAQLIETASRARIRSLLAPFLSRDLRVVEGLDDRFGIGSIRLRAFAADVIGIPYAA